MNAKTSDSLRLFFALWPDDTTAAAMQKLQQGLRGRLTPYANLHVTLAFLGQQPATLLPALKDVLTHLPRSDIVLRLDQFGYFRRNRIAWVGTSQLPEALLSLYRNLVQALVERDIPFKDDHDFKLHITLARDASVPPDMTFDPIVWRANQVVLVQSTTTPEGSSYRFVASRDIDKDARVEDESGSGGIDTP